VTVTPMSLPARGRRGAEGAYTQMERPRDATVEVEPTEPMKKDFPDDRRVILLPSPEVKDEARCRIPEDGEGDGPTSVEELGWSLDGPG